MTANAGPTINGYKFSRSYSEKKIFYVKAAQILTNYPTGINKKQFLALAYKGHRWESYANTDPYRVSRSSAKSHPGNKLWNTKKVGRELFYFPNEFTQQTVDLLPEFIKQQEKFHAKIVKSREPYHTTLQPNDIVKFGRKVNSYSSPLYYGFIRKEDFLTIEYRAQMEFDNAQTNSYYSYDNDHKGRIPLFINPMNLNIYPQKVLYSKESPSWKTRGSNDKNFTDSVVLEVWNLTPEDVKSNRKVVVPRKSEQWSWIKILPLNGEEPFWTTAKGWKKQKK